MNYGWNERPTKADLKTRHCSEDGFTVKECVYSVGAYDVTVPGSEVDVTYRHKYRESTDPRRTLPNMAIEDGEVRIPITDFVGEILTRLEPRDLAVALWDNDEVRNEFIDCLVRRWSEQGVTDMDRRKVLAGIQEAVHSAAVDRLASSFAKIEFELSRKHNFWNERNRLQEWLHANDIKDRGGNPFKFERDDTPELKVGGERWNEARDYWRAEVIKQFPGPVLP